MKHFCDQECLLKFYCQQNEPIMVTQKGPENTIGTSFVLLTSAAHVVVVCHSNAHFIFLLAGFEMQGSKLGVSRSLSFITVSLTSAS